MKRCGCLDAGSSANICCPYNAHSSIIHIDSIADTDLILSHIMKDAASGVSKFAKEMHAAWSAVGCDCDCCRD